MVYRRSREFCLRGENEMGEYDGKTSMGKSVALGGALTIVVDYYVLPASTSVRRSDRCHVQQDV